MGPRKGRPTFIFYAFHYQKVQGPTYLYPTLNSFFFHTLSLSLSLSLSLKCTFYQLSSILMSHILYPHIYTYYSLSLSLTPTPFLSFYLSLPSHSEERETLWKGLLLLLLGFAQLCVFFFNI